MGQESQASSCLRKGTPLASRVAQGVSGPSSATREESGVLGFPSRRGLTPRGSLECNPEIPDSVRPRSQQPTRLPPIPGILQARTLEWVAISFSTRGPDPSSKATLWGKAQHEGALPPPCIVRKDPRVPHTARRVFPLAAMASLLSPPEVPF